MKGVIFNTMLVNVCLILTIQFQTMRPINFFPCFFLLKIIPGTQSVSQHTIYFYNDNISLLKYSQLLHCFIIVDSLHYGCWILEAVTSWLAWWQSGVNIITSLTRRRPSLTAQILSWAARLSVLSGLREQEGQHLIQLTKNNKGKASVLILYFDQIQFFNLLG